MKREQRDHDLKAYVTLPLLVANIFLLEPHVFVFYYVGVVLAPWEW